MADDMWTVVTLIIIAILMANILFFINDILRKVDEEYDEE